MDVTFERNASIKGTACAGNAEAERFERLLGTAPWLIVARGNLDRARNVLNACRNKGYNIDLAHIADDQAFDAKEFVSLASRYRHIVALAPSRSALPVELQSALSSLAILTPTSADEAGVLELLASAPRCC